MANEVRAEEQKIETNDRTLRKKIYGVVFYCGSRRQNVV